MWCQMPPELGVLVYDKEYIVINFCMQIHFRILLLGILNELGILTSLQNFEVYLANNLNYVLRKKANK